MHVSLLKWPAVAFLLLVLLVTACCRSDSPATSPGTETLILANQAKEQGNLTVAAGLYRQARIVLKAGGKNEEALECLNGLRDIQLIQAQYPYSLYETRVMLAEAFPQVPSPEREAWMTQGKVEKITIDGQPRFFSEGVSNVKFRNVDLFREDGGMYGGYEQAYRLLKPIVDAGPVADSEQPFVRPISYTATGTLAVPRDRLPTAGMLKLWFPIPIATDSQRNVSVLSIAPLIYVRGMPSVDQQIGLIYMEVPLVELTQNLNIVIQFTFDHYEQWFQVDPEKVGAYDRGSDLYVRYTASNGNIAVTDEIRATAQRVIGEEGNPYRAAKKLYEYILANVKYSYVPHLALWPRGEPESVYVHRNRYGDCGAQAIYFSALCRSVGIPARTTGGWQLFRGNLRGHFWAEFYLPNYGWLPVDPTAADMVGYLTGVTDQEKTIFRDFFFGHQDHFRCNIQKDVDVPLIPPSAERVFLPMAIQYPAAACDTMEDDPGALLMDYWTTTVSVN